MTGSPRHFLHAILLGVTAMTVQIVLLRQFMVIFYGNELIFGVVFASWLLWVAVGSWSGKFFRLAPSPGRFLLLQSSTFFTAFGGMILCRYARLILQVPPGEFITIFKMGLFANLVLMLPCVLLGWQFYDLAQQRARLAPSNRDPSAEIYILESLGSVAASLLLSLFLLTRLSDLNAVLVIAVGIVFFLSIADRTLVAALSALFTLLIFAVGLFFPLDKPWQQKYYSSLGQGIELLDARQTRFGEIAVVNWAGDKVLYANSEKQTVLPDPLNSQALASLLLAQHHQPNRVLLLSGGLGGLAPELARFPLQKVDYIHFDRLEFEFSLAHLDSVSRKAWSNPKLAIHHLDGRNHLRQNRHAYDLIILNVGRPTSAASNRYFTDEFFTLVRQNLQPNGVFAICNVPSGENYLGEELITLNSSLYKTLKALFPTILVLPGDQALYFAATQPVLTDHVETLRQRLQSWSVPQEYFYPPMLAQYYIKQRIDNFRNLLDDHLAAARLNRDFYPISYFYDVMLWLKTTQGSAAVLRGIMQIPASLVIVFLILLSLVWLSRSVFRSRVQIRTFDIATITVGIGFTSIAFNLLLLLAFQIIFGYVYEKLGLVIAAYMFGMAAGAWLGNRNIQSDQIATHLSRLLLAILLVALLTEPLFKWLSAHPQWSIFVLWTILPAGLTGAVFSLLCRIFRQRIAHGHFGTIYSADLLGGAIGALLVTGWLLPVYGFRTILALIGLFAVFALIRLGPALKLIRRTV